MNSYNIIIGIISDSGVHTAGTSKENKGAFDGEIKRLLY